MFILLSGKEAAENEAVALYFWGHFSKCERSPKRTNQRSWFSVKGGVSHSVGLPG